MSAMLAFSREDGMAISSLYATFALRMRVSMSATGSVIVIASLLLWGYRPVAGTSLGTDCEAVMVLVGRKEGGRVRRPESTITAPPTTKTLCGYREAHPGGRAPG